MQYQKNSNQYLQQGVGRTYWYVTNEKQQLINKKTLKPYKGKNMDLYAFHNELEIDNFLMNLYGSNLSKENIDTMFSKEFMNFPLVKTILFILGFLFLFGDVKAQNFSFNTYHNEQINFYGDTLTSSFDIDIIFIIKETYIDIIEDGKHSRLKVIQSYLGQYGETIFVLANNIQLILKEESIELLMSYVSDNGILRIKNSYSNY